MGLQRAFALAALVALLSSCITVVIGTVVMRRGGTFVVGSDGELHVQEHVVDGIGDERLVQDEDEKSLAGKKDEDREGDKEQEDPEDEDENDAPSLMEEQAPLPLECTAFFRDDCKLEPLPEPTVYAVTRDFERCCKRGGYQDSKCQNLTSEVFSHDAVTVSSATCHELINLYNKYNSTHNDAPSLMEEQAPLPLKCTEFFRDDCKLEPLPEPTVYAVTRDFERCCKRGGYQDSKCQNLTSEVFSHDAVTVSSATCHELINLYNKYNITHNDAGPGTT